MNICITNYDFAPQFTGGIKRVSSILAKEWIEDCNIYFIAISPTNNQIKEVNGIAQYHLPVPEEILSERNIHYFSTFVKEKKIDIILHQHSESQQFTELCVKVKNITEVKLITTRHFAITHDNAIIRKAFFIKDKLQCRLADWAKDCLLFLAFHLFKKNRNTKKNNLYFKYIIKESDKFVLLCDAYKKELIERLELDDNDIQKICAINNPLTIVETSLTPKKKKVIWCGRVEFGVKRLDRMIEIWRNISVRFPDWELIVMGDGDIESFKRIIKKKEIQNITFTGHCNPFEYYKQGSILCMTSSTEGLPMVILEAQMYGCIPIAYNSFSSLDEIITDGVNGYKIPAFNEKKFIERLVWLFNNETVRIRMQAECIESVKKNDVKRIAHQWLEMFRQFAGK